MDRAAVALLALFTGLGALAPASFAQDVEIDVDLGVVTGPAEPLHGFLAGAMEFLEDRRSPVSLIEALRPAFWRLGRLGDLRNPDVGEIGLARLTNARITYGVSQPYLGLRGGPENARPWEVEPGCSQAWECYEDTVRLAVETALAQGVEIDFWDLWNEPDGTWTGTSAQLFELVGRSHDVIREVDPDARIVAPSASSFERLWNEGSWHAFVGFVKQNGIELDAISWHEFGMPEDVPQHVSLMRGLLSQNQLDDLEIHINEFSRGGEHLIPGWRVGWLHYLEQAGVDWASLACWHAFGSDPRDWRASECFAGLDGLFTQQGSVPQHVYWVHRAYADLVGYRVQTTSTDPRTVAIASLDGAQEKLRVLLGRYSCGANGNWCRFSVDHAPDDKLPPVSLRLRVRGVPAGVSNVVAMVERIPNEGIPGTLPAGPALVSSDTLPVVGRVVDIPIDPFEDGDAYVIELRRP